MGFRMRGRGRWRDGFEGNTDNAGDDEGDAQPFARTETFAEEESGKEGDEDDRELVHRRDMRGMAEL